MKRWTALAAVDETERWVSLSERVNALGVPNEFTPTPPVTALTDLTALEGFDHVRISSRIGGDVAKLLTVQSTWTTLIGVVDGMTRTPNGWWPLCALHEALGEILVRLGPELDPRGSVLIAGAGGAARVAVGALFKAGFTNFMICNHDEAEARAMITESRRRLFGLNIEWTPIEQIVMLPGESSMLVNATADTGENKLITELSYLNFLRRTGFVIDFGRQPQANVLVQEAREAKLGLVTGQEIATRVDRLWAKWVFAVELAPSSVAQT